MTDLLLQAVTAHRSNNLIEAERLYKAALAEQPHRADAHFNLGMIFGHSGRASEALSSFILATSIKEDFGDAWLMRSAFADQLGKIPESVSAAAKAVHLLPTNSRAWLRYGLALNKDGQDAEAITAYREATSLEPTLTAAWINLCVTLKKMGQFDEAKKVILKAIHLSHQTTSTDENAESTYGLLQWHLALLELAFGNYVEGFALFRARFRGGTDWRRLESTRPLWRGENLADTTILVTAEQGHGDLLMMARYLPYLKAKGARLLLQSHPALVRFFKTWDILDEVLPFGQEPKQPYNFHVPMFDLPYRFGTQQETIPSEIPYLPLATPRKTRTKLERLKVAVNWAGLSDNPRDMDRSIPLSLFSDIFSQGSVDFFNFTRELKDGDARILSQLNVNNLAPALHDFFETAQQLLTMDLVITCDTAMAHLAGGLGKDVWTLLPFSPDWRWGLGGERSVWYPTMRLFRQHTHENWSHVVQRVKADLARMS